MTREAGVKPARFPPLCTGNVRFAFQWPLFSIFSSEKPRMGRPRSCTFELEVRKPCLLQTEATTYAPGKGQWRHADQYSCVLQLVHLIKRSKFNDALDLIQEIEGVCFDTSNSRHRSNLPLSCQLPYAKPMRRRCTGNAVKFRYCPRNCKRQRNPQ